ncbi:E3 SUMO-protein ligase ZBED1-like [Chiloscyllium plagiosum]|uniref:E3 SUMO-protein ligase ZBED1-like n=1 Tax=Chiloscyllium plagiosum TaxID=36176 RepID=UPI001CB82C8D|nr:E3 SUMO-protein ligase ZBED1-like [Chiloscyllium plagiosum]XP_043548308.1 E3 SUMO-protein ligase ZBED1-like [Chiloscyllium plagiosum]XP_043548309.1 E3 SUMO-protein ligase ZBED1-like [Chiloscyllium plagiosum]XP_043548310.1 E3 SUMO-protein ligase ZBED1-like [Chiloscyllium plagiosum]XP_043548311.1 E3 SUMO-protein ligase ZBED1-like [Chiloscyllium plagiosum]XP_043548312.1 E3 SUMO-protein ligase ZBED1-like [Chiloscyllium plagiosum]XP_043548313.1 E3 SUMO-protein ligase ZBED1-like [Chiloscyllium p
MEHKTPEGSNSDLKLVCHPRAKSKVWKYFGFDTDAEGCILQWKKIYCRVCRAQIAYSGNTSNLAYHLEKNHPSEFHQVVKSNAEQVREPFTSNLLKSESESAYLSHQDPIFKTCYSQDSKRHQEMTSMVTNFICEGLYPVSVVEEQTFKKLLKMADPRYELPNRKHFSTKAIPERYHTVRTAVEKELAAALWCGVTADLWTVQARNRYYMSLTAHFVGGMGSGANILKFTSKCLATFEVVDEYTTENLAHALVETFREWGISKNVLGATTSSDSENVVNACSLLNLPVHMPCFGRAINLGINRAIQLPKLCILLLKCTKLVEYFKMTPRAVCMLREKQKQQYLLQHQLVNDCSSWGTTLSMLQRLREQQIAIAAVLFEDSMSYQLMPEASEWSTIDGLVKLLQPFQQATEMMGKSKYPLISMVKPLLHVLLNSTLKVDDSDSHVLSAVKETIAKELSEAYALSPELELFLHCATFLDPRYKKVPFLSASQQKQVENKILEEATALLEKGIESFAKAEGGFALEEPPLKKRTVLVEPYSTGSINFMLAEIFGQAGSRDEGQDGWRAQVVEELNNFKSQKVLELNEDPLIWWSDRVALFPTLSKLLQKYWCIPATSLPSERLFSAAGNLVNAKRNQLAPAEVDRLLFLYENTRVDREVAVDDDNE